MPIAHVKAGVAAAAGKARQGHAELQSLRQEIDQAISRVQSATQGTTRAEPSQAIASWQQAKSELEQAAAAIMSGADRADQYAARI